MPDFCFYMGLIASPRMTGDTQASRPWGTWPESLFSTFWTNHASLYTWLKSLRNVSLSSADTRGIVDRNTSVKECARQVTASSSMNLDRVGCANLSTTVLPFWSSVGLNHATMRPQIQTQLKSNMTATQWGQIRQPPKLWFYLEHPIRLACALIYRWQLFSQVITHKNIV